MTTNRTLTSEEALLDLAAGSVVILHSKLGKRTRTKIFKTYFGTQWIEMDPTDRDDGSREYDKADLWIIATERDGMTPDLAYVPGDAGILIESVEQVTALPDRSVLVVLSSSVPSDSDDILQKFQGAWTCMNPWDRSDGEYALTDENLMMMVSRGTSIQVAWIPETASE